MYIKSAKDCQYIGVTDYNPDESGKERNQRVGQVCLSGSRRTQTGVGKYDK
ncbi:MAG: hypothetical protein KAU06_02785 [Candidatus Marinimicrobia bacterium]|nr:hypothetical protein [Candidatus Neomarinimicrobiota bacterium]